MGCEFEALSLSTLLKPSLDARVVGAALKEIPSELTPRKDDTVETLVARISQCTWLDFRWLQSARDFYTDPCKKAGLRLNAAQVEKCVERVKAGKKRKRVQVW